MRNGCGRGLADPPDTCRPAVPVLFGRLSRPILENARGVPHIVHRVLRNGAIPSRSPASREMLNILFLLHSDECSARAGRASHDERGRLGPGLRAVPASRTHKWRRDGRPPCEQSRAGDRRTESTVPGDGVSAPGRPRSAPAIRERVRERGIRVAPRSERRPPPCR